MSSRKRISLGGFTPSKSSPKPEAISSKANRQPSSLSSWAVGISKSLNRSLQSVAATAERKLFADYDEQEDEDSYAHNKRCSRTAVEFEFRYRHLVETLGDLSLAADIDPEVAAVLLDDSSATEDLDTMLMLLRAEERQNSRAEHCRSGGSGGGGGLGVDGSSGANGCSGDMLATPCLEFLLEERVVKLLCELGTADRPAGTLALVLGAMASLLGQVSHPLLPSQAVHDPIVKLVAAAGAHGRRLEGAGGSGGGANQGRSQQVAQGSGQRRTFGGSRASDVAASASQARKRARVQANLARLLGAIWRKLREESALLDFFLRADSVPNPGSSGSGRDQLGATATGGASGTYRLDVFDRLLPLLELPGRAGQQAREACLVALSVKDPRVGQYITDRTELCAELARTLSARYQALYDTLEELQVAAVLPVAANAPENAEAGLGRVAARTEANFSQALSLFVQHLRFCNAVGLVAADTQACLRLPSASIPGTRGSGCGGGNDYGGTSRGARAVAEAGGDDSMAHSTYDVARATVELDGGVATLLACQVRHLLLDDAIGPALTSALESRARWTTTIAARTMTELSAGVEGYGVAVAGLAASVEEGSGGRRQLGPLVDTVSAFLVGREGSGSGGNGNSTRIVGDSAPTSPVRESVATSPPASSSKLLGGSGSSGSMVLMTSRSSGSILCLRDVLLRRLEPCSPSLLRISTLELLASLAELRDDRVLLDLVLRPRPELSPAAENTAAGGKGAQRQPESEEGEGENGRGVEALLDASPGRGALEGLRVSRAMVDSFGSAFVGSPIHPNYRLFSASSHRSLEGYLVAAQQRQIHQLMEGGRGTCNADDEEGRGEEQRAATVMDDDMLKIVVGDNGGKVLEAVAAVAEGMPKTPATAASSGRGTDLSSSRMAGGGEVVEVEFDAAAFVRKHGRTLANSFDADGSFLHALFDCLEAVFERTLEENLAVTGVLSSLCLAATAAEVSPVRRLLLLLLFDGTQDAPFRSMRRILEKLWASAQERVASLPNAPRLLEQTRASLGMPATGDSEEGGDVAGATGVAEGGRQCSRGMREELNNSKRRKQPQQVPGISSADGSGDVGAGRAAGEAAAAGCDAGDSHGEDMRGSKGCITGSSRQQQQHQEEQSSSSLPLSHFLGTYVFMEEFLKELFCALSAKNGVESDAQGLSESHRRGSVELLRTHALSVDGEASPKRASVGRRRVAAGDVDFDGHELGGEREKGGGVEREPEKEEDEVGELPISLDEFLKEAAFPTFVETRLT